MKDKSFLPISLAIAAAIATISLWSYDVNKGDYQQPAPSGTLACTSEAKECPGGTYVSRKGPHCEFAECPAYVPPTPAPKGTGVVMGTVSLSPICPVDHLPPDAGCTPKPYQTDIAISKASDTAPAFATIQDDASGTFTISLPVGQYVFQPQGGDPYPRCNQQLIQVIAKNTTTTNITCDTGIR